MDYDLISLMQFLSANPFPSLEDISAGTNATKRQTLYRLEKLNKLFRSENIPALSFSSSPQKNIEIPLRTQEAMERLLASADTGGVNYLTKEVRLLYLYLLLFLNTDYLSLTHVIDALKCSRSTVLLDFKDLRQLLDSEGIRICNNRQRGYYLDGSEIQIRSFMIRQVVNTLSRKQGQELLNHFLGDRSLRLFDYSRQTIEKLTEQYSIRLIEARLIEFIYIFIFLRRRIQGGIPAQVTLPPHIETDVIPTLKEYDFTLSLLRQFPDMKQADEADIKYITSWFIGISYGSINEDTMDRPFISSIARNMILRFETISGIHIRDEDKIFVQLYAHLRPAYYRMIFQLPIFNPIHETVKREYAALYRLTEEALKPFSVLFNGAIPEDEISYLTMHFAAAAAKGPRADKAEKKTALVICPNGVGSSMILHNELTRLFPEIHFLSPQDSSVLSGNMPEADILFTTENMLLPEDLSLPVIRMNPVMSAAEKSKISRQVYRWLGITPQNQPDIDAVMNTVSKYADVHNETALRSELLAHFYGGGASGSPSSPGFSLADMVRPEIIRLGISAGDRESAIRMTYAPMVEHHYVLQSYVDEVIRTAGRYIVITKYVALPHTKPEAGACACALGIGVLKEPVVFGNPENDPVKYIFALSAINNSSHLNAMADLIYLLNDKNFYHLLDHAADPEEIMAYIRRI